MKDKKSDTARWASNWLMEFLPNIGGVYLFDDCLACYLEGHLGIGFVRRVECWRRNNSHQEQVMEREREAIRPPQDPRQDSWRSWNVSCFAWRNFWVRCGRGKFNPPTVMVNLDRLISTPRTTSLHPKMYRVTTWTDTVRKHCENFQSWLLWFMFRPIQTRNVVLEFRRHII